MHFRGTSLWLCSRPGIDRVHKDRVQQLSSSRSFIPLSSRSLDVEPSTEARPLPHPVPPSTCQALHGGGPEDEYAVAAELLKVGENPLTVTGEDALKKRYKIYGKWLRGKSLFKQQPVE